jgi:hypothetical protein
VETAFAVARRQIAVRAVLTGLVIPLAFGAIALVLWIGGRDLLAGRISAGDLSGFRLLRRRRGDGGRHAFRGLGRRPACRGCRGGDH